MRNKILLSKKEERILEGVSFCSWVLGISVILFILYKTALNDFNVIKAIQETLSSLEG